jgi:hypothetical protein
MGWDGATAKADIWKFARGDKAGSPEALTADEISKARQCFLKVASNPTKQSDFSYPYVSIDGGKPTPDRDGLIAAKGYAGQYDKELLPVIDKILAKEFPDKSQNAGDLSYEYCLAVTKLVMSDPQIWDHVKSRIHVTGRAIAGGQLHGKNALPEGMMKFSNAAFVDGDVVETPDYFDVPTVFAKEGVFTGTNGIPTLKRYEVLKANANRFLGMPITDTHLTSDSLKPNDRWLGHAVNVAARDDKRDLFGISRYYKKELNANETERIKNRQFPDASPGYFTITKSEEGEFDGKKYNAVEIGPYVASEYANFFEDKGWGTRGACTREMGCGPFKNAAPGKWKLIDGEIKWCKSGDNIMEQDEFNKLLNSALKPVTEAIGSITTKVDALEKKMNAAPVPITEVPEFKTLVETVKTLNAALPDIKAVKDEREATKLATQKEAFAKQLNAANTQDGKPLGEAFEKVWNAATDDPLGRDHYLGEHPEVRLQDVPTYGFRGKVMNAGGESFDLATEQAKTFGY